MKGNEEASAKAFVNFLADARLSCHWNPAKPDNDFPDFDFEVQIPSRGKSERWAVECTDLHQYVSVIGQEHARIGADKKSLKELQKIARAIEEQATFPPSRRYSLWGSDPPFNLSNNQLVRRALEYIENDLEELEELDFQPSDDVDPRARAAKDRVARDRSKVWMCALPGSDRPGPGPRVECVPAPSGGTIAPHGELVDDIYITTCRAVERALKQKLPKFGQCSHYDARVLILWCTFPGTEVRHVAEAVEAFRQRKVADGELAELAINNVDLIMAAMPCGTCHSVADLTDLMARSTGGPRTPRS